MLKVAITGNIASGKSSVEEILKEKSYKVLDTDTVAHDLLKDENVKNEVKNTFANYDILENNNISRTKLGKIIFGDENSRKKLESILHPLIKDKIINFFNENKNEKFVFVSVPLLFEANFEKLFDKIILVYADDKIRLERLMKRNDLSNEYAKNRIKIQTSQDEKTSLADFILYNNKTLNELRQNLDEIIELL